MRLMWSENLGKQSGRRMVKRSTSLSRTLIFEKIQTKTAVLMTFAEVPDAVNEVSLPAPAARPFIKQQQEKLFKEFHCRMFRKQKGHPEDPEFKLARHTKSERIEKKKVCKQLHTDVQQDFKNERVEAKRKDNFEEMLQLLT